MNKSLKNPPQLNVFIGISGSGKTTKATQFISQHTDWVRVNRDDIRRQLLGTLTQAYYTTKQYVNTEKHITNLQDEQIRYFLQQGYNVIVDNTHLKKQYLDHYLSEFNHLADIHFEMIDTPLQECIDRVTKREGAINTDYIERQYRNFTELVKLYGQKDSVVDYPCTGLYRLMPTTATTKCILVDIDGTIATHEGKRNAYDHTKVLEDEPIDATRQVVKAIKGNLIKRLLDPVKVIYLSGRDEICREATIRWLKQNGFPFDGHLYMRATGDKRMDKHVKKDLYTDYIHSHFKPVFVLDDRLQVCHMWYKLGLFVLNANQGLKHF